MYKTQVGLVRLGLIWFNILRSHLALYDFKSADYLMQHFPVKSNHIINDA